MKKKEIIEAICLTGVPPGASPLVEYAVPGKALRRVRITRENVSSLHISAARDFIQHMKIRCAGWKDEPDAALFAGLHSLALEFHQLARSATLIDAVQEKMIDDHRKCIAKLREIAKKLNITYTEPADPLL